MPAKHGYNWEVPVIEKHSKVKHDVIREYLTRYIEVLTSMPHKELLRLYVVDGFAGGGWYKDEDDYNKIVYGSPILLHNTVKKVETRINFSRTKKLNIEDHYFFVDIDNSALQSLKYVLKENNITLDRKHLINKEFTTALPDILNFIKNYKNQRVPRCIFLLDQYGYKNVPLHSLNTIFTTFPNSAEVILTFSTDSIINYYNESDTFMKGMQKVGLEDIFTINDIKNYKESPQARLIIEQRIYDEIGLRSGAKFFTPFFIKSNKSSRSYWLIHLSNHPKARDEMCKIHWSLQNHFVHHGNAGLNSVGIGQEKSLEMILGYSSAESKHEAQLGFEFLFDDDADARTRAALITDIPKLLKHDKPVSYNELVASTCNGTPANTDHYKKALYTLHKHKQIVILNEHGNPARIRSESGVDSDKTIVLPKQIGLF
ncbi:MAG: three-Cys-motif partner protein TcmP [Gammaproteobacteria bacterium]|nr:three-Cys-motif partner protein TcmP [Gammaproteobacteria bacterium]